MSEKYIAVPLQTAGYVGHLTPQETSTLAVFWLAVLHYFATDPNEPVDLKKVGLPPGVVPSSSSVFSSLSSLAGEEEPATAEENKEEAAAAAAAAANGLGSENADGQEYGNGEILGELSTTARTQGDKVVTKNDLKKELWLAIQDNHPHSFLLRFLRARKFDIAKSLQMAIAALHWRVQSNVQRVIEQGEAVVEARQMNGKALFYKQDKHGRPVIYMNVALHNKSGQDEEMLKIHTIYMMETARLLLKEPVGNVIIVFNMANFGLQNMDNNMVKFLVTCLQDYYPESLGACLIVCAPWVFSGIWRMIKPWLDPVVQRKVQFLKDYDDLQQFIDRASIPKAYNGGDPYVYQYMPPTQGEIDQHRAELADDAKRAQLLQDRFKAASALERTLVHWASACVRQLSQDLVTTDDATGQQYVTITKGWQVPLFGSAKPATAAAEEPATAARRASLSASLSKLTLADDQLDLPTAELDKLLSDFVRPASEGRRGGALWETWWAYDNWARFHTYWHRIGAIEGDKLHWDQAKPVVDGHLAA
ncbi:hypothetical protein RI367_004210 [Sorochytrium milnesiophthora]